MSRWRKSAVVVWVRFPRDGEKQDGVALSCDGVRRRDAEGGSGRAALVYYSGTRPGGTGRYTVHVPDMLLSQSLTPAALVIQTRIQVAMHVKISGSDEFKKCVKSVVSWSDPSTSGGRNKPPRQPMCSMMDGLPRRRTPNKRRYERVRGYRLVHFQRRRRSSHRCIPAEANVRFCGKIQDCRLRPSTNTPCRLVLPAGLPF